MRKRPFVLLSISFVVAATAILQVGVPLKIRPDKRTTTERARNEPTPRNAFGVVTTATQATNARIVEAYGKLPLSFEANRGQADSDVKFLSRGGGYSLFLTATEAVMELNKKSEGRRNPQIAPISQIKAIEPEHRESGSEQSASSAKSADDAVLRMKLVGANASARIEGADELPGKSNYFIGNDPAKWRTNVPTYTKVKYEDVYPGIDLVYYGNQRQLEYDFVVAPGADPRAIRLAIGSKGIGNREQGKDKGAGALRIDGEGDLVLGAEGSELRLHRPVIYQEISGVRQSVGGNFVMQGTREVGFEVARYDASKLLIIDPVLSYSTYLGGNGDDSGYGIVVDSAGNAYMTGSTGSPTNFPTANPLQISYGGGGQDAFVAKLNVSGSALVYSTYLGGNSWDYSYGIAVDAAGNVYVTGYTQSTNFPTVSPLQGTLIGGHDAFVAKLNPVGSALVYSTYLGGTNDDVGTGIAVDLAGNVYVTGYTASSNFPTVNSLQGVSGGGVYDAFVAKLNASGSALVYSTYLGGSGTDQGNAIAVDMGGNAYVTGQTGSPNFPMVGALQGTLRGGKNAFLAKLNASGSALVYSTYLGGNNFDAGNGIALDSASSAYVTGYTNSINFPTANPIQRALAGGYDAFVAKLNASGSVLVYSTYLGGSGGDDQGNGIVVDSMGNAYVTGYTKSANFPTISPLQGAFGGSQDAFVAKLNASGSALVYSTDLGGTDNDLGNGIAVDSAGNAYVTGYTKSTNFPTASPLQGVVVNVSPWGDAFVAKISPAAGAAPTIALNPTSLSFNGARGAANPANQTVSITNLGGGILLWTATASTSSGGNWLSISPPSGTAPSMLTVSVSTAGLLAGTYNATIVVAAAGSSNTPQTVAVTLTFNPSPPSIGLNTSIMSFTGIQCGANPANQIVSITNTGVGILLWTATASTSSGGNWLSISPPSGTAPSMLTASVSTAGLATGTYNATIVVAAAGSTNTPQNVFVQLIVGTGGSSPRPQSVITPGGIVNGASFAAGAAVVPGSIISIFGSNLANCAAAASSTPLLTALLNTSVAINAVPIPLYYVSPTQINAQVPFETPPGTATLAVTVNGVSSPPVSLLVAATAPGIFLYGTNRAVAVNADGSINASDHPAKPGDVIVVYMTGQGAVSNPVPSGAPALASPLSETLATTTATIGGATADVLFSGLAPGFVGLLQANIRIPNVAAGDQPLVVTIGGAASPSALITVGAQ